MTRLVRLHVHKYNCLQGHYWNGGDHFFLKKLKINCPDNSDKSNPKLLEMLLNFINNFLPLDVCYTPKPP